MSMNRSRTAMIIVAAVVVICGASFYAVRSLNKSTKAPAITVSAYSASQTTQPTAAPTTPPTESGELIPTPALTTAAPTSAATDPATTDENRFTTFATMPTSAYSGSFTTQPTTRYSTTPTTTSPTIPTTRTSYTTPQEAQQVINEAAKTNKSFLGYQFDPVGQYYFTEKDPWQRNFGFNEWYDFGASFMNFYYDTFRCKFEYGDKEWMIQFWKGQYGLVFLGSEIGCYYRPLDRENAHYDAVADEDMLYMSMTLYRKGEERASRDYAKYWWCTAFIPGTLDSFRDRSELTMRARLTMKDKTMLDAFVPTLEANSQKYHFQYTVSGRDVYLAWT